MEFKQMQKEVSPTVSITIKVVTSDRESQTIQMLMLCNNKVSDIVEEIAELTNENKYKLAIIHKEKTLKLSDGIAENNLR